MSMKFLKTVAGAAVSSLWEKVSGNVVAKDTSASVGIGTDDPLAPFEVMSTTNPLAMFSYNDSFSGEVFIAGTQVNAGYDRNANATLYLNYRGYNNGETQFRDTIIADGKTAAALTVDGSSADVTINAGNLVIGTAGKGIDFSAQTPAAGMTAELLDHYEEGTWTCTLTAATPPTTPPTVTGQYTRVGRMVNVSAVFANVDTSGGSGTMILSGLPFTTNSAGGFKASGTIITYGLNVPGLYNALTVEENTTNVYTYSSVDDSGWHGVTITAGTTKYLNMTLTYVV